METDYNQIALIESLLSVLKAIPMLNINSKIVL